MRPLCYTNQEQRDPDFPVWLRCQQRPSSVRSLGRTSEEERGPVNPSPVPTVGTAGVEPPSVAQRATAARPEALETQAGIEDGRRHEGSPQNSSTVCKVEHVRHQVASPRKLLREEATERSLWHCNGRVPLWAKRVRAQARACTVVAHMMPREDPIEGDQKHECGTILSPPKPLRESTSSRAFEPMPLGSEGESAGEATAEAKGTLRARNQAQRVTLTIGPKPKLSK